MRNRFGMPRGWLRGISVAASAAAFVASPAFAQEQVVSFDIPSQPLSAALLEFGRQGQMSVAVSKDLVSGKTSPEIRGQFSRAVALERLLAGTDLRFEFVSESGVRIFAAPSQGAASGSLRKPVVSNREVDTDTDRVVVIGTTIRGLTPESSPIETYSREDIAKTGATTTEQLVRKLPQNSGTTSPYGSGATANISNLDVATAIDLRGLGVGTTLTLLNGHRMALSNSGQSADVSFIPLSAIERVEVLTDGASAIYGSDAIGGVVNFILRDNFDGAESRASVGGVSRGGLRQSSVGHTMGARWGDGHGLVSYDYFSASALETSDRDYAAPSGPGTLTPVDIRHNLFATMTQGFGDRLSVDADAGVSWRKIKTTRANLGGFSLADQMLQNYRSQSDSAFANVEVDYQISDAVHGSVAAAYSAIDTDGIVSNILFNLAPPSTTNAISDSRNSQLDIVAKLDGSLFELPGGTVRFSVGGGVLDEKYKGTNPTSALLGAGELGRRSTYGFGELYLPLVSPEQNIPLLHRLSLDVAGRYTEYKETSSPSMGRDFGDSFDPKIGVAWSPTEGLTARGTYGSSFRAPSLVQLDPAGGLHYLLPQPIQSIPSLIFGMVGYAVPDLAPETAHTYTIGFDYRNPANPDFRMSLTYYNIDYSDRIATAPTGGLNPFATPGLLPDLIYRPPSAQFIDDALRSSQLLLNASGVDLADPTAAAAALFARDDVWMFDVRFKNLALSRQDGIDFSVSQTFANAWGDLQLGLNLSHILNYEQQGSAASEVLQAVDVPGQPADWRGRAFAGITNGSLSATVSVNYIDDYVNRLAPIGQQTIGAWTTIDVDLGYDLSQTPSKAGARLNLSVQNLLDEDPPFLSDGLGSSIVYPIGFDPANANPLGRMVLLSITQRW